MKTYKLIGVRIRPADDELLHTVESDTCPPGSTCAQAAVERVRLRLLNQKRTYSLTKRSFVEQTDR